MPNNISSEIIESLQKRVYELLDQYPDSYNWHHIRNVEKSALKLADLRNLDPHITQACALLHDHGRIVNGIIGKPHAEEGAIVASEWLSPYDLREDTKAIILSSIHCHNLKKDIHHPYAELLKDADSLAHSQEFPEEMSRYESIRVRDAFLPPAIFELGNPKAIKKSLTHRKKELDHRLKKIIQSGLTTKRVHNLRINIRQSRAILWLAKNDQWDKNSKKLNKRLRDCFKIFEYPRQLSVLAKALKKAGVEEGLIKAVNHEIYLCDKSMASQLKTHRKAISNCHMPKLKVKTKTLESKLTLYADLLIKADTEDIDSLHTLRIHGKKLKYLIEEGILIPNCIQDYEILDQLHKTLGSLNDIPENRKLLNQLANNQGFIGLKTCLPAIDAYFQDQDKALKKEATRLLFRARKRWLDL